MAVVWTSWRTFPAPQSRISHEAPSGPGVFEVRHIATGEQIAFGVSAHVAKSLQNLIEPAASGLRSIFARRRTVYRSIDLEYRFCATDSLYEAHSEGDRLDSLRRVYIQRRKAAGWS